MVSGGAIALACLSIPAMSAHADEVTYGYDALGRLTSVTAGGAVAYYDYDAAGNLTAIRR
ncbi:RHS repeat protein [Paraburkholderia panacisoli]|uniref:RHS repeat protein n=2 Tax=Paraburkholderia panacisoli TaxID=2603818 RepID=A0A5B0H6Y5_9BURK|nr:RHS repeat protein [Paraburkholderia panacisoli]